MRLTIGFLSTWSVYEGTTIDSYTRTLLQGISSAAQERDCNLLLACGVGLPDTPRSSRTAWSVPGPSVDFVPVGPWNTDGLIIIPDDLTEKQYDYVRELIQSGFPVIFTTTEKPGPVVAVDNAGGIRKAFNHLVEHGHEHIAFIAGKTGSGGDSAERLAAFRAAQLDAGFDEDPRLIAYGEHRREDGRLAMRQIIATGAPFTAVLASNDLSGMGAIEVLRSGNFRIPEDVAVVSFDDILEARSHLPALTTVRHPTFMLGYEAVVNLISAIESRGKTQSQKRVPTRLIVRQSCGCHPKNAPLLPLDLENKPPGPVSTEALTRRMAEATLIEARKIGFEDVEPLCSKFINSFSKAVLSETSVVFTSAVQEILEWLDKNDEDVYVWHLALSVLHNAVMDLLPDLTAGGLLFAGVLIDRARLEIDEQVQRQTTRALLKHMEMTNRLGLMTSQLQSILDAGLPNSAQVLSRHLSQLGLKHVLVAIYSSKNDDPVFESRVILEAGLMETGSGAPFVTRDFPPPGLYSNGIPFQLALLPLVIDERTTGFVALSAQNIDPCAAITYNLASALRTSRLYHEALEGRQMAEDAMRLKNRFLSMVSHELRTPLSLIVGLSEVVVQEQQAGPSFTREVFQDIQKIRDSAQHMARMVGDVLDLASSETGQLRILLEPLDLAEVLRVAATFGKQLAGENGLEWVDRLPAQGPWVLGDPTRLRQVVLNLISNAVKFTSAGKVSLEVSINDHQVTVVVSDTGIGILPEEQEELFHEFHRTDRSIEQGYHGLGLGLAISKQLIEKHGGTVGVRSPGDLGRGSSFYFTLPIASMADFEPSSGLPSQMNLDSIILLSDQPNPSNQLHGYLHERGFEVQVFSIVDDEDWLTGLDHKRPVAIIMDEALAARQGWDLLLMLKDRPSTENVPVFVYSLDNNTDQGELLELNYLHKPLRVDQLAGELVRLNRPSNKRHTVLVVDDDPGILDLHTRLVERAGGLAIAARNGREAMDIVERILPDLILLDLMMPVMDGFETLDALRAKESTREIPVIVLTARMLTEADIERCNRSVASILSKGVFNSAETLQHIEIALRHQQNLGRATQRLVRNAMAFIHTHYAAQLSREVIAGQIGVSSDYLTQCFRDEFGLTPITYLNRYRIQQARRMLEAGERSIREVALAVGFTNSSHFTRKFQREVGVSPKDYRRGERSDLA